MGILRAAAGMALLGAFVVVWSSPASAARSTASTGPQVSVFPLPGSQVAPPRTEIVFRGINPFLLGSVKVSGSESGNHTGQIRGDSDGNGGSFVADKPFMSGETVTVSTSLNLVGASGGSYQFRIANSPGPIPRGAVQRVGRSPGDVTTFHSRPDLHPAAIKFLRRIAGATDDDLFLDPQYGPVQNGPMIFDQHGNLIYFRPLSGHDEATDLKVQHYLGHTVLTWWQGYTNAGVGVGQDQIYDSSYQQLATVSASGGLSADLHEFLLTPAGTALIVAYYPVAWDASPVGGSKQKTVLDSVIQEIDVKTGLLLFQWDSLDHVPVRDSEEVPKSHALYDYFHINSIQVDSDGNLIISARNTWAVYKINRSTGAIMWTLGGRRSSFKMKRGAPFAFQHDAQVHGSGDQEVTMFDDGAGPPTVENQSRALTLHLDFKHMVASVAAVRTHSPPLRARYQGNVQTLPDGGELVGWGQQPYFTEYGRHGKVLLDGRFVGTTSSYRAYVFPAWSGHPTDSPAAAATNTRYATTVYASWNGSTDTVWWLVLSGEKSGALYLRRLVRKSGFETAIQVPPARYAKVEALGARGDALGSSPVVKAR